MIRMNHGIDVRHVLPTIGVPTLVLHRTGNPITVGHGRYLGRHIKGAKYAEFPGIDHNPWVRDANAVHIGARIGALAASDEVLVSRTVSDLVAGSGLRFEDRGTHRLKGVPGSWQLLV